MSEFNQELFVGNIMTSRVRLARNLQGCPFRIKNPAQAKDIAKKVNRAIVKADTFNLYFTSNLSDIKLEAMKERHLISKNLIANRACGAALINQDESISVMVNEEDIIREQCFKKGFSLSEAYKQLSIIDNELEKNLTLAYDEKLGYLTACPTNLGPGLRASVMMFLPALTMTNSLEHVLANLSRLNLTIRGVYGEGSDHEGFIYQISNKRTLGLSEQEIIDAVKKASVHISEAEISARKYLKYSRSGRKGQNNASVRHADELL